MSDANGPGPPIQIERIETERLDEGSVVVRLSGRWQGRQRTHEGQELLVVERDDGRHRFPAMPEARRAAIARPGAWSARFVLPDWCRPEPDWEASMLIGDAVIPVPGSNDGLVIGMDGPVQARHAPAASVAADEGTAPESQYEPRFGEDPRSGPLSKLLLKDTVAALHAELEHRATTAAQLRGQLADTHAELQARMRTHAQLETTHGELRRELDALGELVRQDGTSRGQLESELTDLRRRISDLERELEGATDARAQDAGESASLRSQLSEATAARDRLAEEAARLRDELATVRATSERETAVATRARAREEDLSSELASLHAELASANVGRDSARSEATGLRTELDRLGTELATLREHAGSQGELGEARSLLSDARALSALLRERQEAKGVEAG
jgi:predicted  nucleic acid-binding Zn-ribbon protein